MDNCAVAGRNSRVPFSSFISTLHPGVQFGRCGGRLRSDIHWVRTCGQRRPHPWSERRRRIFVFSFNASQNTGVSGQPSLHLDSFNIVTSVNTTDRFWWLLLASAEPATDGLAVLGSRSATCPQYGIVSATVTLQSFADSNNNLFGVPAGTTVPPPGNLFNPPLVTSAGAVWLRLPSPRTPLPSGSSLYQQHRVQLIQPVLDDSGSHDNWIGYEPDYQLQRHHDYHSCARSGLIPGRFLACHSSDFPTCVVERSRMQRTYA